MDGLVEIITGRERRRRWSLQDKVRLVAETNEPGGMIRAVAARHGVCESLAGSSNTDGSRRRDTQRPPRRYQLRQRPHVLPVLAQVDRLQAPAAAFSTVAGLAG